MNTKTTASQTNENLDNADFDNWADWYAREDGWNLCYCTIAQIIWITVQNTQNI